MLNLRRRTGWFGILLCLALLLVGLSVAQAASPPQPTYGTANVDGDPSEWDLSADFFANMYEAGKDDKDILSYLYLRYDCSTQTLYALVLVSADHDDGLIINPSNDDNFIKLGNTTKLVDGNSGDDGTPPDFQYVYFPDIPIIAIGWEASASLAPGTYNNLNVHAQIYSDDETRTSAVKNRKIKLVIECPTQPDTGHIILFKDVDPNNDDGKFDLLINEDVVLEDAGNGDFTWPPVEVEVGEYTVSETAGDDTSLADYDSSVTCYDITGLQLDPQDPEGMKEAILESTVLASADGTSVDVEVGKDKVVFCLFHNERKGGELDITKVVDLKGLVLPSDFTFEIDVDGPDGYHADLTLEPGETETLSDLEPGEYTVSEDLSGSPYQFNVSITPNPVDVDYGDEIKVEVKNTIVHPNASFGSCYNPDTQLFRLRVVNNGGPGYVGYRVAGETGPISMGWFDSGEEKIFHLALQNGDDDTLVKLVSLDEANWKQVGGTHVLSVDGHTRNNLLCKGELKVKKVVDWKGFTPLPDVEFNINIVGPNDFDETVTLGDGETSNVFTVYPGDYTLSEDPGAGYTVSYSANPATIPSEGEVEVIVTNTVNPPNASFGSCYSLLTQTFTLTVINNGGPGYIGYDVYTEAPITSLGFFNPGETKVFSGIALVNGNPDTLRKFVSLDNTNWKQAGGTHVFNPEGHIQNGHVCKGELTLKKQVNWNGNNADFGQTFTIRLNNTSYPAQTEIVEVFDYDGGTVVLTLPEGVYDVQEDDLPAGWTVSGEGLVTVQNGSPKTKTIRNTAPRPDFGECAASFVANDLGGYLPGTTKGGGAIDPARTDANNALGFPQNNDTINFVSLGFGDGPTQNENATSGVITLGFGPEQIINVAGPDITVWETSFGDKLQPWGNYPEAVKVYASQDGLTWTYLGTTTDKDQYYDLGPLAWARYIRLVDVTNPAGFPNSADGFDVDAVTAYECDDRLSDVTIIKRTNPDVDRKFNFNGSFGKFSLRNGEEQNYYEVEAGEIWFSETVPSEWYLTSIECTVDGEPFDGASVDLDNGKVTLTLHGEDVVCVFTNERGNRIRILKYEDVNQNGSRQGSEPWLSGWEFTLYDDEMNVVAGPSTTNASGILNFGGLPAGTYKVCETDARIHSGPWVNTQPGGDACYTITFEGLGDSESIRFGNYVRTGSVKLTKVVSGGDADPNSFGLTQNGIAVNSGEVKTYPAGTEVTLDEAGLAGYSFAGFSGNANCPSELGGSVTVVADETIECIITNTFDTGSVKLRKTVVGGSAGPNDFGLTQNGVSVTSGQVVSYPAGTEVTLDEAGAANYVFTSITGDAECPSELGGSVTVVKDKTITCTITNTYNPPTGDLTVTKTVNWNGYDPIPGTSFTICIKGPSYPTGTESGACQIIGENGGPLYWTVLGGEYTVTESDPGSDWTVTGQVTVVDVPAGGANSTSVTNTYNPPVCDPDPDRDLRNHLTFIYRPAQYPVVRGQIHNTSDLCSYDVGMASYKMFSWNTNTQQLIEAKTGIVGPGETISFEVQVCPCATQVDLFYGPPIQQFNPSLRYGPRLLDAVIVNWDNMCVPEGQNPPPPPPKDDEPPVNETEEPPADETQEPPAEETQEPPAEETPEPPTEQFVPLNNEEEPPTNETEEPPSEETPEPPSEEPNPESTEEPITD